MDNHFVTNQGYFEINQILLRKNISNKVNRIGSLKVLYNPAGSKKYPKMADKKLLIGMRKISGRILGRTITNIKIEINKAGLIQTISGDPNISLVV